MKTPILIDGLSQDDLLKTLADPAFEAMVFHDEPIIFSVGTSTLLTHFHKTDSALRVEISHIEGGGEGVLLALSSTLKQYGKQQHLSTLHWYIHATDCIAPNPKLGKILILKGFVIQEDEKRGEVYYLAETL